MRDVSPELLELEQQLSHPSGAKGLEIAEMMNATNIGMTRASILQLGLEAGQEVLELGHGNCGHLPLLLEQSPGLRYTGLEISEAMRAEARRMNADPTAEGRAAFVTYDGEKLPFPDESFDKMFAVNSLYFWPEPEALLREIHRVLRPGGLAAITFAHKNFMQQLPFIGKRFRLYDNAGFSALAEQTPFVQERIYEETEQVRAKNGDLVERTFSVGLLLKA
jgi:SAM-dependent methyltransferase